MVSGFVFLGHVGHKHLDLFRPLRWFEKDSKKKSQRPVDVSGVITISFAKS